MSATQPMHDGFLRLPLDAILSTRLIHIVSALDDEDRADPPACGRPTSITGYTEWASVSQPYVSLGWDWRIEARGGEVSCVRVGLPRSNVMLVDAAARDYGWDKNLQILATVVDAMAWTEPTCRAVSERYG